MPTSPDLTCATGEVFLCPTLAILAARVRAGGRHRADEPLTVATRAFSVDAIVMLARRHTPAGFPCHEGERCGTAYLRAPSCARLDQS
jgi:hypothetical protein